MFHNKLAVKERQMRCQMPRAPAPAGVGEKKGKGKGEHGDHEQAGAEEDERAPAADAGAGGGPGFVGQLAGVHSCRQQRHGVTGRGPDRLPGDTSSKKLRLVQEGDRLCSRAELGDVDRVRLQLGEGRLGLGGLDA